MAGAQAQTVSASSLLRSPSPAAANVNVLQPNGAGAGPPSGQSSSSLLAAAAAAAATTTTGRRSQFGGVNMLAGFSNNPFLNGVSNPGLAGIPQSLTGTANSGLSVGAASLITGSNSDFPDLQQKSVPVASESLALSGLAAMGLPTSPVSISSTIVNSMVNQQGNSPLSRLEHQQDLLLQQQQQQQQVRSATPPLSATAQMSQLSHLTQSMHQERSLQASQQLAAGQQTVGFSSGVGSQLLGVSGNPQALLLGGGSQQVNGLGPSSNMHQGKASGSSPQQALGAVKVEPQSLVGHSLQQQQQILIPKMEVKSEVDFDQKVAQHTMLQARSANSLGLIPEMQLQEVLMQRQQSKQIQAQFSALQQQRLLQGLPPQQHLHDTASLQLQQLQQHQHHQQLQLQQQANFLQSAGLRKHPDFEAGGCARRLMQYLYHQRHRPPDNNIAFWRNFVGKYFAPNAKKRWCVSLYVSGGRQPTGIFPQDVWHCEICGTNPGRGFETTVEVLPRLFKIKFDSGIQEELLFVDLPHEYRQASGHMVLEYGKAIQESVFEQLRVVREGQLRIVFSSELKILSWEFCARSHEELLLRRLIVPQVNQLAQISQKYQSSQSGGAGVSAQDLQTNCHLFVTSARQLAKNLELPTVNDLGYTKRYVRCLQISEVVNSMKDLIDFSRDNSVGPIASLHKFPRRSDGSSRAMLRNAQIRALQQQQEQQQQQQQQQQRQQEQQQQQQQQQQQRQQEQQQQQQQQQQQRQQEQQQQQQRQQEQQQQQQQQEELDLHSLLADTNTPALSGLQQQFNETTHLDSQTVDGLDEAISAPTETDPLSSFFQSNSLAALQTSLHDTLQSPVPHQTLVQSSNPLGTSTLQQQQQQQQLSSGRALSGSSPTNSLSSFQNSFPSISGGGVVVGGQSSSPYLRGESSSQQNMVVGAAAGNVLLQQQSQSTQQQQHQASNSNVVHHLLQEMMINQQLNNNSSNNTATANNAVSTSSLHQGLGSTTSNSLNGNLSNSLAGNLGLNAGGQVRMLGLGSSSLNGLVNNHHLAVMNSSSSNIIDGLVGGSGASSVGVGNNVALSALGNHTLRGVGGGNTLGGLMGNMNAHNARLNLAAAVAQQQNQLQHDLGHPSLHHDLGGNNMLGGLGMTGSFGGLFN